MNRFMNLLTGGGANAPARETKGVNPLGLVAFHTHGTAHWNFGDDVLSARAAFMRNPIVYRCVRMVAEAAASIPLKVCETGTDCDQHSILELLQRPNERMGQSRFLEALYGHLMLSGEAYALKLDVDGRVREMHVLDPQHTSPVKGDDGWPIAWNVDQNGQRIRYQSQEVLQLTLFNPVDETKGFAPVRAALKALDTNEAAVVWNKALLDNSARPSGALVYTSPDGGNMDEEQFDRLKRELEDGYTGASMAGRPMLLEGGLDWKAMGFSPKDMDFLEAKNGAAREIALAFGVPPMLLGIPGDNTYANYREANTAFWRQTVLPLAKRMAGDLGHFLLPNGSALVLETDSVPAFMAEREALWARVGAAQFLTVNEKRRQLGFEPVAGGDELNV